MFIDVESTLSATTMRSARGQLPTPALVIDSAIVGRNVRRMADYARQHGLRLRPHTKTHKSLFLAAAQLDAGAAGLTVAKVGEAQLMAEVCNDLLLAYPAVDPPRCEAVAALARDRRISVALDTLTALDAVAQAARRAGTIVGILVDLDVGLGRTGVQSAAQALSLAQSVEAAQGLRLDGLFCYPGHIWQSPDHQEPFLKAVSDRLQETLDLWAAHGLAASTVSGGSTPTAYRSHLVPQLTEIRPGTYIFNDMNTALGGFCSIDDCAARIVCTVVSDAVPGKVIVDAGSKTLTSDRCIPAPESGHGHIVEYPQARISRLSEEHGEIEIPAGSCDQAPKVGERLTIIPNHICPCINLQDRAWWLEADEVKELRIDARGRLS